MPALIVLFLDDAIVKLGMHAERVIPWIFNQINRYLGTSMGHLSSKAEPHVKPKILVVKPLPWPDSNRYYEPFKELRRDVNHEVEKAVKQYDNMQAMNVNSVLPSDRYMFNGTELSGRGYTEVWCYLDDYVKFNAFDIFRNESGFQYKPKISSQHPLRGKRFRPYRGHNRVWEKNKSFNR